LQAWQCNSAPLFHTGWFVDSLATQILVIFIIRTANPLQDRPHPLLVASSLLALTLAVALPYSSLASWFGFVPVPALLMGALSVVATAYFSIDKQFCGKGFNGPLAASLSDRNWAAKQLMMQRRDTVNGMLAGIGTRNLYSPAA
jgi:Mg2+-importing ATPase